jgi:hypothetical protein
MSTEWLFGSVTRGHCAGNRGLAGEANRLDDRIFIVWQSASGVDPVEARKVHHHGILGTRRKLNTDKRGTVVRIALKLFTDFSKVADVDRRSGM